MSGPFSIRSATNGDCDAIRELVFGVLHEHGLSPDPTSTDSDLNDVEKTYHQNGGCFDVLIDGNNAIIGSVAICRIEGHRCELRKMYLNSDYRGKGLGKKLALHGLMRARELGFHRVELETASVLRQAVALYSSLGFKPFDPEHLSARCDRAMYLDLTA